MSDDDDLFRQAMSGVVPLADRSGVIRTPRPIRDTKPPTADRGLEVDGTSGRARGVTRSQITALRGGDPSIDQRLDLHGHRAAEARAALEAALGSALESGRRHLLVIHGRGAGSGGDPVLPGVVVEVLRRATEVLGFCRAAPKNGGDGATSVLLRRDRQPVASFSTSFIVGADAIDELGHVSNLVYLRWVLEVAMAHSVAVGLDAAAYAKRGEVFVVRRHEIDYLRSAYEGQHVRSTTWVDSWKRASCVRRTDISSDDGELVFARASTLWALVAPATGRPVRIGADLVRLFGG